MRTKFIRTQNVNNFIGLIENLKAKPQNIPKMGLVYGEPGEGLGNRKRHFGSLASTIRLYSLCEQITAWWLLEEMAKELDEIPRYMTSDIFNQCVTALCKKPKIIIIDEIDYLLGDNKTIKTLRDIHDKTDYPIIFVGMGLAHKRFERHKHLYDRISEIVKFET